MEARYPLEEENAENDNSKCHENAPMGEFVACLKRTDPKPEGSRP